MQFAASIELLNAGTVCIRNSILICRQDFHPDFARRRIPYAPQLWIAALRGVERASGGLVGGFSGAAR